MRLKRVCFSWPTMIVIGFGKLNRQVLRQQKHLLPEREWLLDFFGQAEAGNRLLHALTVFFKCFCIG